MRYEWFIAKRYLRPQGGATFIFHLTLISMGGVALGVASLITVLSVMNGFGNDLRAKILQGKSHILIQYPEGQGHYRELQQEFQKIPNVQICTPVIQNWGVIFSNDYGAGNRFAVQFIGMDPTLESKEHGLQTKLVVGDLDGLNRESAEPSEAVPTGGMVKITDLANQPSKTPGVVIGTELAAAMFGVGSNDPKKKESAYRQALGARITLITVPENQSRNASVTEGITRYDTFRVIGVFETGHYDFDSNWIYIPLRSAQVLQGLDDKIDTFQFWLYDHNQEATRAAWDKVYQMNKELTGTAGRVSDWMEFNHIFFDALEIEKRTMDYILKIIILVATFNIIATLFMVVTEKTRDIGLLRAIGAGRKNILFLFLSLGILVGAIGAIFGAGGGFLICKFIQLFPPELPGGGRIYYLQYLPCEMELWDFINVSVYTFFVSFLASIYPAVRAARFAPVEALRFS